MEESSTRTWAGLSRSATNPNKGEGYYQKGDRKQAVAAYQKSLQLDPTNQNAIDKLKELKAKPKPAKKS